MERVSTQASRFCHVEEEQMFSKHWLLILDPPFHHFDTTLRNMMVFPTHAAHKTLSKYDAALRQTEHHIIQTNAMF